MTHHLNYRDIPESIQVMVEQHCADMNFSITPHKLVSEIEEMLERFSVPVVAILFEISPSLVWAIRDVMCPVQEYN